MEYLTVQEFAAKLRISDETVRRAVKAGLVRAVQLRWKAGIRIPATELKRLEQELLR